MSRPTWDETFMEMAVVLSKRVTCRHYKVGAVIARENQFLSSGYNGSVRGEPHCNEVGCAKEDEQGNRLPPGSPDCRGAHAEINAITNAANLGVRVDGAALYVTIRPCYPCAKQIVNAGIKKVVYLEDYDGEPQAISLFNRVGVGLVKFDTISKKEFEI